MTSHRNVTMLLGLAVGGAVVFGLSRATRERPCATTSRADALLGGGLLVCLGHPATQRAAAHGWHCTAWDATTVARP